MDSANVRWISRSMIICLVVGVSLAQFQQQNPFFQQQHQTQRTYSNVQQNRFNQQQARQHQQQNAFSQQPQYQAQNQYQHNTQNSYNQHQPFGNQQQQHQPFGNQQHQAPRNLASSGSCPQPNGRFPVASQCDAYIECVDGVAEEKLCPEGLLFNAEARFNYPCGYPIDVKCEGRSANVQPANPTEDCPHQYGYFKIGDRQNCGKFMNCVEGRSFVFDCPEGLAYNPESYRCDWPDQVADCDAEAFLGFSCPLSSQNTLLSSDTKFYRSPNDCQHYYVCVDNRPRLQNCGKGHAFNELINACDAAENVTGCVPLPSIGQDFEPVQLDVRTHNENQVRSFGAQGNQFSNQQQYSFNQQNSYNQQQNNRQSHQRFGSNQQQANNQYTRQRFSTF